MLSMKKTWSTGQRNGEAIADRFLKLYYDAGHRVDVGVTWKDTRWMGVPVQKIPMDLWLYQEILFANRPDLIIECGTAFGGSALYLASILELLGSGAVMTIDIDEWKITIPGYTGRPSHPRITYVKGSSTDAAVMAQVKDRIAEESKVMVILDSDHSREHVLAELHAYAPLVTPGQVLIVEDTMLNGHPVHADFGPGPMEAMDQFLAESDDFTIDPMGAKFLVSFNPRGYLRRL